MWHMVGTLTPARRSAVRSISPFSAWTDRPFTSIVIMQSSDFYLYKQDFRVFRGAGFQPANARPAGSRPHEGSPNLRLVHCLHPAKSMQLPQLTHFSVMM